ncbi:MAG: hypothetical protein GAK44_00144 [Pseudomonas delhiensis]|nr:MAG: hypothetical protein GAK44_00144 [Pseudomonas delhiensis]
MATRRHHIDERLIGVTLLEQLLQVHRTIGDIRIQRGVNAADHRRQVRNEGQTDIPPRSTTQPLADFRQVTVPFDRIGHHALAGLTEQRTDLGAPSRAANTGLAVGNQARGIGQSGLQQRNQPQLSGRRVATGHSDQACRTNLLAIDLRQSVHRLGQQFRRAMRLAVPLGPLFSILQTEVGRQVDDPSPGGQQLARQSVSHTVRRREEHHVTSAQLLNIRNTEDQAVVVTSQVRVHVGHLHTLLGAGSDHFHTRLGVLREQAQQFDTRVPRATYDTDLDHLYVTPPRWAQSERSMIRAPGSAEQRARHRSAGLRASRCSDISEHPTG